MFTWKTLNGKNHGSPQTNMSDLFSVVCTFTKENSFSCTLSRSQWYLHWICLVLLWQATFFARWIEVWLSKQSRNYSSRISNSLTKFFIQITSLPASTASKYSASVVDSATNFQNLDCNETTPPTQVTTYPNVDRLVSTSANMFESVKPSNRGLAKPNQRHKLEVPSRYWSIHLTVAQFSLPRLLMYRLTTLIAYPMSDLVHTIAYIRLWIVEAQGTFIISTFSFFCVWTLSSEYFAIGPQC